MGIYGNVCFRISVYMQIYIYIYIYIPSFPDAGGIFLHPYIMPAQCALANVCSYIREYDLFMNICAVESVLQALNNLAMN